MNKTETKEQKSIREKEIKDFFYKNNRFPDIIHEKKLYSRLVNYCSPSCPRFSPKFNKWARREGYGAKQKRISFETKRRIKDFYKKHKRLPSGSRSNTYERLLCSNMRSYCKKKSKHCAYDLDFDTWARKKGLGSNTASIRRQKIKDFFRKHGRLPLLHSKNKEESKLGQTLSFYCRPSHRCFDYEINSWARKNGYNGKRTGCNKEIQ